jgi:hypothetical protein
VPLLLLLLLLLLVPQSIACSKAHSAWQYRQRAASHLCIRCCCCCCCLRLLRVVKLTLLGSIISNLLLVMGSAFVAGGILHPTQSFNQQGVVVNCGLLVLAGAHSI